MEYILTEKGLVIPIIVPLVWQAIIVIDIVKRLAGTKRRMITIIWCLLGSITGGFLYLCGFNIYLCYIWILTYVIGYPVLYGFDKLGDLLNKDVPSEESKIDNIIDIIVCVFMSIVGCIVLVFVCLGGVSKFFTKGLEMRIAKLSEILYLFIGILCFIRAIIYGLGIIRRWAIPDRKLKL